MNNWRSRKLLLFETADKTKLNNIIDIFKKHGVTNVEKDFRVLKRREKRMVWRVWAHVTKDEEIDIRKDVAALSLPFSFQ